MLKEIIAFLGTMCALAAGMGLVMVCKRCLKVEGGAFFVAILFAPIILYLGLSGRIVEFKGLGMEAKFQQQAAKPVTLPKTNVRPVASSASAIQEQSEANKILGIGTEVVLLTTPSTPANITHQTVLEIARQIYPGLMQGNFALLAVVDSTGKVLGYFQREFFFDLLRIEIEQFIHQSREKYDSVRVREQLEQTQLWHIVANPRERAELAGSQLYVQTSESNAEALHKLAAAAQETAIVTTPAGIYAGIVRRSDIIAELLGALIEG